MGWLDGSRFVPLGVIDFNQSFVGHPLADLGAIWWQVLKRDRDALGAFLDEARLPGAGEPGFPRLALAWTLMTPFWRTPDLEDLEEVSDLEQLALRWFGTGVTASLDG